MKGPATPTTQRLPAITRNRFGLFRFRKSSNHSSFANSSRLIAGYYVLLRLLVPRHPSCALINLTTDIQRCSRPLCSSQATGGPVNSPVPTSTNEAVPPVLTVRRAGLAARLRKALARSLRTQQCAWSRIPSVVFQSGEPDVLTRADCTTTGRCSTLEQPPRDMCSSCGPGRLAAPDAP